MPSGSGLRIAVRSVGVEIGTIEILNNDKENSGFTRDKIKIYKAYRVFPLFLRLFGRSVTLLAKSRGSIPARGKKIVFLKPAKARDSTSASSLQTSQSANGPADTESSEFAASYSLQPQRLAVVLIMRSIR